MELFPEREADSVELDVGSGHVLYVEQSGKADGIPVIYLHGGPASGAKPDNRRLFDPDIYRLVIFDQRGSGRSMPHGHLQDNDLQHLVDDIERIRCHYGIERWLVYGGSWGGTLALAYAEAHPGRVSGMLIRSVFLARACDLEWHNGSLGASSIFPEAWQELCDAVPAQNTHDPIGWIAQQVLSDNPPAERLKAAEAWDAWTGRVVTWRLPPRASDPADSDANEQDQQEQQQRQQHVLNRVGVEMHYALNNYFLRENQLLQRAHLIPDVPIHILHGRCDMTCTISAAWDLHLALPQSKLQVLPDAGHLSSEPQMQQALLRTLAGLPQQL